MGSFWWNKSYLLKRCFPNVVSSCANGLYLRVFDALYYTAVGVDDFHINKPSIHTAFLLSVIELPSISELRTVHMYQQGPLSLSAVVPRSHRTAISLRSAKLARSPLIVVGSLWGLIERCGSAVNRSNPDSKVHVAHMGPTWVLSAPGRPHVGPMNLAIREGLWGHQQSLNMLKTSAVIRSPLKQVAVASQLAHSEVVVDAQECRNIVVTSPKARIASQQGRCRDVPKLGKISTICLVIN